MPIYEYQCKKCGQFETMQKITDRPLTRCPTCQSKVTKLMSNTSFQLKGSGWYITDYGRKDSQGGDSSSKESKAETKSESKTETSSTSSESKASKSESKTSKASAAAAA
ncbi:MAG: FmdB family zinc ribbon protein [Candidatus Binatia bacterium]